VEIYFGVSGNGFGPAMVTWQDIAAWSQLTGERLSPFEARVIVALSHSRAELQQAET
jgi:hypothetical protein